MREIKFSGKQIDNGEWVYGGYCYNRGNYYIIPINSKSILISKNTLGQFTGLRDKNGKEIYEGDIVVTRHENGLICSKGDIQFSHGVFGAEWVTSKENKGLVGAWGQLHNLRRFDNSDMKDRIEIIGNIHNNPELLKV